MDIYEFLIKNTKPIALTLIIIFFCSLCFWNNRLVYRPCVAIPMHFNVGAVENYNPLCFKKENGEIDGIEIDIIKEIARRTGRSYTLSVMPFEMIIPSLQCGEFHFAVGGMAMTHERSKCVFFSIPYLHDVSLVAISFKKNLRIQSIEDLKRYKIVVEKGYFLAEQMGGIENINFTECETLFKAIEFLKSGKCDLFIAEERILQGIKDLIFLHGITLYPLSLFNNSTALAISKYYLEIADLVDYVLQDMIEDGTMDTLKKKWNLK